MQMCYNLRLIEIMVVKKDKIYKLFNGLSVNKDIIKNNFFIN